MTTEATAGVRTHEKSSVPASDEIALDEIALDEMDRSR